MNVRRIASSLAVVAAAFAAPACTHIGKDELPAEPPQLVDMEEPVPLLEEPKDEAARAALPLGSFTGVTVGEGRRTLDDTAPAAPGLRVTRVVENSPGDAAGIEEDDLLLAVRTASEERELRWPSEWRKAELDAAPGAEIEVVVDRAGDVRVAKIRTVARLHPADRTATERYREEKKAGVVLRTATEVEARAAGLGPGGGAVVVGLSARSPWRAAGVRFEDVVASIDGRAVGHPQEVLEAIRNAKPGDVLAGELARSGERIAVDLPVTRRERDVHRVHIPLVYSYELDRGTSETSIAAGAIRVRRTGAAWEWRLLWLLEFRGGDADRLVEVDR